MKIIEQHNMTKNEIINAINCRDNLSRHVDETFILKGYVIFSDGEKVVTVFKTDKCFMCSISQCIKDFSQTLSLVYEDKEIANGLTTKVVERKSQNNRRYLKIEMM